MAVPEPAPVGASELLLEAFIDLLDEARDLLTCAAADLRDIPTLGFSSREARRVVGGNLPRPAPEPPRSAADLR